VAIKCPKCHSENPETKQFCADCGTQLPPPQDHPPVMTETLRTPVHDLTTGSTFAGRYQVIEELGHGGMGKVYKVFDTKIKEKVALKLIKPEVSSDRDTIERFNNEIRLARRIRHRNVCGMFDLGEAEGAHFITMEYVHGEDLKSMIRMSTGLTVGTVLSVGKQVCDGLAEAHSLGVVHRDLKPQNIMIDKGGNAKIMDFGIARSLRERGITGPSVMIGTPEYMSPEQAEAKEVDPRSDIYSFGIILYEMATGRVPFEGETALSIAMKQKGETPKNPKQFNPNIPDDLSGVILKCLEKDEAKRYQTAVDVRSELEKIEKGIPTTERVVPEQKPMTSREITVKFSIMKRLLAPVLIVVVIALAALAVWLIIPKKHDPSTPAPKSSIAVLPFEDLSQAKNNEALCDGISGTLIDALTNIEGLWVPAQTSAFSFKGKTQEIREIGRKLAVDNVLEGTVQVAGDNLRVTARISNVHDNRQVWSEIYNRKIADLFSIQDDIAKAIVTALKVKLLGEKSAPLVKNYTQNPEAYRLYLLGRSLWNKRGEADVIKSIGYFEKATEIDPNYALAYAGLADAYGILGENGFWLPEKAYPKAKAAVAKALEIDNKLAEAHTALAAMMRDYDWDFVGAEKEFKLAIELNPGYATAHQWYGELLSELGRHEEGIREVRTARNLDPLSPRIGAELGWLLYFIGRYDQAFEELNKALEVDPHHAVTHEFLGWVFEAMGKYDDAVKCYLRAIELGEGYKDPEAELASCYALMGRREEARKILDNLIEYSKGHFVSSVDMAFVFAALGEKDQTFAWLEKAFLERDPYLLDLRNYHRFDSLHSDPRFTALLRKIGLER
jgi:serine/threonine protein kinase/tetratricopeptide (TPR) repeat protein